MTTPQGDSKPVLIGGKSQDQGHAARPSGGVVCAALDRPQLDPSTGATHSDGDTVTLEQVHKERSESGAISWKTAVVQEIGTRNPRT